MKLFKALLTTLGLLLCLDAWAQDLYVCDSSAEYGAEDGLAVATCFDGSADVVWGTSSGEVGPDDRLYVCGNWNEAFTVGGSGTAGHQIIIEFDGDGASCAASDFDMTGANTNGITSDGVDYFTFEGGRFHGARIEAGATDSGSGIDLKNGVGIVLNDTEAYSNHFNGVQFLDCQDCEINRPYVHDNDVKGVVVSCESGDAGVGCGNVTVSGTALDTTTPNASSVDAAQLDCRLTGNGRRGVDIGSTSDPPAEGPIYVRWCNISNNGDGVDVETSPGSVFEFNAIYENNLDDSVDPYSTPGSSGFRVHATTNLHVRFNKITCHINRAWQNIDTGTDVFDEIYLGPGNYIDQDCTAASASPESIGLNIATDQQTFRIISNIFVRSRTESAGRHILARAVAADSILAANTFYGGFNQFVNNAGATGWGAYNNIFAEWSAFAITEAGGAATMTLSSNDYFRDTAVPYNIVRLNATTYTTADLTSIEATALNADPLFIGGSAPTTAAGFKLRADSTLRRTCTELGPMQDHGNRAFLHPPSCGAWEAASGDQAVPREARQ